MGSQSGSTKTDTVVKLVLIFFISLLSFSVGTFVGKQVSDSDHRRATLEDDYGPARSTASTSGMDGAKKDRLSEDEIASLAEEFISSEKAKQADAPGRTIAQATPPKPSQLDQPEPQGYRKAGEAKPAGKYKQDLEDQNRKVTAYKAEIIPPVKKAPEERSPTAARIAEGKAPTPDPKVTRKPDSVLPSVASSAVGKFTVQVASFADENEAKNHAASLKEKGWNSFYIPAKVGERTWYRVSVGLFTTSQGANEFRSELMREANIQNAIVQKIVQ